MATFSFIITNKQGSRESGRVEALSPQEAITQIKKIGWFVVSLKQEGASKFKLPFISDKEKFSSFERIVFTDHLTAMFESGAPMVEALETYRDEEGKKGIAIIDGLVKTIQGGKKLSEAMALYPSTFSPLYLALVQSGELTGRLDETLEYLAKDLRRDHEFSERIKSALFYPVLVLSVALFVIIFLVLVVIPKIMFFTKSLGGDLPLITRIVSTVASFLAAFGPFLLLLGAGLLVCFFVLLKNKKTKEKVNPYLLRFPLIGNLLKKYILTRFLRIVGSCLKYGIPLNTTLSTVGAVVDNPLYKNACKKIEVKVVKGISLSEAIAHEDKILFPRVIVRTIKGAEKTGTVDEAMIRLSKFYEDEIDRELKRITDLIEPVLVVVLGVIVAAIAISVVAPIYQMTSKIK